MKLFDFGHLIPIESGDRTNALGRMMGALQKELDRVVFVPEDDIPIVV